MKKHLFIIVVICSVFFIMPAYAQYIVVNKANPIEKITKNELRNIYLGNKISWQTGLRILVADYNFTNSLRQTFSDEYLEITPQKVSMIWIKVSLSGKALPPKIFRNEDEIKSFIAENEGGIGYLAGTGNLPKNVKVIQIQ